MLDFQRRLRYNGRVKQRTTLLLILCIAALVVLDQASKWAIVLSFPDVVWEYGQSFRHVNVWGGPVCHLDLARVHNTGVAFGTGNGTAWAPFLFLGVQVVALVALTRLYAKNFFSTRLLRAAWVLIMAGVLGNMADRLTQGFFIPGAEKLSFLENLLNGYVVDFLDFSLPWLSSAMSYDGCYHWPSFNVADSCVCTAAALFLLSGFLSPKTAAPTKETK